ACPSGLEGSRPVSYLLDTNVISELRKPERRANPAVRSWPSAQPELTLHPCVITILEIDVGIGRVRRRDPIQASRLQSWLEDELLGAFAGRILPIDVPVARGAAQLHVRSPRPERDALIAGTAAAHGLAVVTRNVEDFEPLDVAIINPW